MSSGCSRSRRRSCCRCRAGARTMLGFDLHQAYARPGDLRTERQPAVAQPRGGELGQPDACPASAQGRASGARPAPRTTSRCASTGWSGFGSCSPRAASASTTLSSTSEPNRVGCFVSTRSRRCRPASTAVSSSRSKVSTGVPRTAHPAHRRSMIRSIRGGRPARVPGSEVQFLQLGEVAPADHAAPVTGPVQPPVVYADQVPVTGQPHIALEPVSALGDGAQVRRKRVLGQRLRRTAMREHQRARDRGHGLRRCRGHCHRRSRSADRRSTQSTMPPSRLNALVYP